MECSSGVESNLGVAKILFSGTMFSMVWSLGAEYWSGKSRMENSSDVCVPKFYVILL